MSANVFLVLLLMGIFFLPWESHAHSDESPSFKYSREANANPSKTSDGKQHHEQTHERKTEILDMREVWMYSMGSTILISAAPFLILFVISLDNSDAMRPRLKVLLAFASGGLLGDAFLHLIPHATNPHDHNNCHYNDRIYSHDHLHNDDCGHSPDHGHNHNHSHDISTGLWVLGGIIVFLTVEKIVRLLKSGHGHTHSNRKNDDKKDKGDAIDGNNCGVEISGYLNLAADFAHNFTDGLAIGASYLAGNEVGVVTTITILLHEVPHEIGDYAILIKSGCTPRKAIMLQLLTAAGALTGNALALIGIAANSQAAPWVLPFTAGGFIYIATVSVLPELLDESTKLGQSIKEITALLAGVAIMILIATVE